MKMSHSDTYVPGMNSVSAQKGGNDLYSRHRANANLYSNGGTFVPGMQNDLQESVNMAGKSKADGEPVVGFLYSISRKGIGEYWPLHLGANTIGRSSSCDIQLKEASVSDTHATLSIKRMKTTQALIASVRDTGSKNGMYLNDEELDYENHSCKNGDVLTVGSCYQLLLMLVNATEYGLKVAEDFVSYDEPEIQDNTSLENSFDNTYTRNQNKYIDDGTVDLSGNRAFTSPGETKIM